MNNKGVTLLELMVSIMVTVVLLGTIFVSLYIGIKKWEEIRLITGLNKGAIFSMDRMTREIRNAVGIYTAEEQKLTIDVDVNPADTNPNPERVSYYLDPQDPSVLLRKIWGSGGSGDIVRVLTDKVHSLSFTYRNEKNEPLSFPVDKDDIRLIEINLVLREEYKEISVTSSAELRNIK